MYILCKGKPIFIHTQLFFLFFYSETAFLLQITCDFAFLWR